MNEDKLVSDIKEWLMKYDLRHMCPDELAYVSKIVAADVVMMDRGFETFEARQIWDVINQGGSCE